MKDSHARPANDTRQRQRPGRLQAWIRNLALAGVAASALGTVAVSAQTVPEPPPSPKSLKGVSVPEPSNLYSYVLDRSAAIRLGKALFWDMQVGSDGLTACASCHFQAGADSRSRNQLSPGLNRMASASTANPDNSFQVGGPNYQLKLSDFPFHQFADPRSASSAVVRTSNDITSSQGVFSERFVGTSAASPSEDVRSAVYDPVFHVGAASTRRVEPRNTPTVINAVFNFRNFWDGRAQYLFNGVNPFGGRDSNAKVYRFDGVNLSAVAVRIDNASLASQASGPPTSAFEMSADGRSFMDLGRRLLGARPLARQKVDPTDSQLGGWIARDNLGQPSTGLSALPGMPTATYAGMVKAAFQPVWWNGSQIVRVNADGSRTVLPAKTGPLPANEFTQMEANFSLLFALAIQMYETTLVSDDSPFDRTMVGDALAMTASQKAGLGLFFGKGKCASCHGGPEFTNASVAMTKKEPLQRMVMGDGGTAVYDEGFYNSATHKTLEDIINGGKDPAGQPISNTGLAQKVGSAQFQQIIGISTSVSVGASERIAVNGAAKTPTIRNVELTAPYFHNGSVATLRQVVEFYNRGGNFAANNRPDLDPDIQPLGLSEDEITQLVDFMHALTDQRVRLHQAPFDHPQLVVPIGHVGDTNAVQADSSGRATTALMEVPAVGVLGYYYNRSATPANFLNTELSGTPTVSLVAKSSGLCAQLGGFTYLTPAQMTACNGSAEQRFKVIPGEYGQMMLVSAAKDAKLAPFAGLSLPGTTIVAGGSASAFSVAHELWRVVDAGNGYYKIYNWIWNSQCLDGSGASLTQSNCASPLTNGQLFKLVP